MLFNTLINDFVLILESLTILFIFSNFLKYLRILLFESKI